MLVTVELSFGAVLGQVVKALLLLKVPRFRLFSALILFFLDRVFRLLLNFYRNEILFSDL